MCEKLKFDRKIGEFHTLRAHFFSDIFDAKLTMQAELNPYTVPVGVVF